MPPFTVLAAQPGGVFVLAPDADWVAAVEREGHLGERLAGATPLLAAGRQVHVTATHHFPGGRTLFDCVALIHGT